MIVHAYRVVRHTILWPTEWEMVVARQFLSRDKVAVDVGANFGLFTSVLARHSKSVVAFEPNLACAKYLARVMPSNCEIIAKAVSDGAGTTMLRVPVSNGVAMAALATIEEANRFDTETRTTGLATYPVETVTLDEVMLVPARSGNEVGFINIDAEGHEFSVLKGAESLMAAYRPVLLVELEYRHGAAVAEVFAWLEAHRYIPRALTDGRALGPIDPEALRNLQSEERLAALLAGKRHTGYLNNIFFLPED